jgi:hypothetical protein
MKAKQVAVLTYHKYPGDDWLETEFSEHLLTLPTGQTTQVKLAERGVCLSNKLWVREIRKLTERGHQTAILATDYQRFRLHWGVHVCQMVAVKLLQVYA